MGRCWCLCDLVLVHRISWIVRPTLSIRQFSSQAKPLTALTWYLQCDCVFDLVDPLAWTWIRWASLPFLSIKQQQTIITMLNYNQSHSTFSWYAFEKKKKYINMNHTSINIGHCICTQIIGGAISVSLVCNLFVEFGSWHFDVYFFL